MTQFSASTPDPARRSDSRLLARLLRGGRRKLMPLLDPSGIASAEEVGRSSQRNRRALASAVAALALRASSFVLVLVTVPLTLDYLGPTRFGVWMTLASVVALLGATDLGIGNGVLNNVARAFGRGDRGASREYLASGLVAMTALAAAFGSMFLVAYSIVPWATVYNVAGELTARSEAGPATAVLVAAYLLGLPLGLVSQTRSALQEGFVQSAFEGAGNLITLVLLVLAISVQASLPILVIAMTAGRILAGVTNWVHLLAIQRPWLRPRRSDVTRRALRSVVTVGLSFMAVQIAYAVAFSSDPLVLAQLVGAAAVADYSVVLRLFAIPMGLATIALLPLWPAYREAITRSDIQWVRTTLTRSLLWVFAVTAPLAVVLSIAGPAVVDAWTLGALNPPHALYPALGVYSVVFSLATVFWMLLNGAQAMVFHVATMALMAILNIVFSVYLASRIGVVGVVAGSVISLVSMTLIPTALYVPRLLRRLGTPAAQKVAASQ